MRLIKKLGYKYVNEFYKAIHEETIDVNNFIDMYVEAYKRAKEIVEPGQQISAENYNINNGAEDEHLESSKDVLVIDQNVKGVEYSLAKCCNPVFGFVTINRGIKIHRKDCPNAKHLREGLGYRFIKARWAGKGNSKYNATLRIVGNDDIGIVNNITSIISKENGIMLRSIDIKSDDGLFQGTLTVMISETRQLENLIKKLRTVKGVKNITR